MIFLRFPTTGLDRPMGFQEAEAPEFLDNRHMKVVRLSALRTSRLYPQEVFMIPIICGDINVNYLTENGMKRQLDAMLVSHTLTSTVKFRTKTWSKSSTTVDNILLNALQFDNYSITRVINGLSDHDTQLLTRNDINLQKQTGHKNYQEYNK